MNKNTLILCCASLCISMNVRGQDSISSFDEAPKYVLFLELGGNGGDYSVNIERTIINKVKTTFSGRIGASYILRKTLIIGGDEFLFPITFSVLRDVKVGLLELGFGNTVVIDDLGSVNNRPTAIVGYRYYNARGYMFKVGFTPFFEEYQGNVLFTPWVGLGLGFSLRG